MTSASQWVVTTLVLGTIVGEILAKPTVYMKNDHDNLEPLLLPISSTVIPIPVYQVSSHLGVRKSKNDMKKYAKLKKPDGPTQLITISGLKKMMANEQIKPH